MVTETQLLSYAEHSPPIAEFIERKIEVNLTDNSQVLSNLFSQQLEWKSEFLNYIKEKAGDICIVGNASNLIKNEHGLKIDKHSVVIRFNNYCSESGVQKSIGSSISVWVKSPSYITPKYIYGEGVSWSIISGPDILYTMSNWSDVIQHLNAGSKVLTPPLYLWNKLVKVLEAPPSAGILMIAWILEVLDDHNDLNIAGFQLPCDSLEQYHHDSPRHNWIKERNLLEVWRKKGLNFIDRLDQ